MKEDDKISENCKKICKKCDGSGMMRVKGQADFLAQMSTTEINFTRRYIQCDECRGKTFV